MTFNPEKYLKDLKKRFGEEERPKAEGPDDDFKDFDPEKYLEDLKRRFGRVEEFKKAPPAPEGDMFEVGGISSRTARVPAEGRQYVPPLDLGTRFTTPERAAKSVATGILQTPEAMASAVSAIGATLDLMGAEAIGKGIERGGEKTEKYIRDFTKRYFEVPDKNFIEDVFTGVGSFGSFLGPAKGVQWGLKGVKVAPKIASVLGTSAMSVLEAMVEMGGTVSEMKAKGYDPRKAAQAGWSTFWLNLPLNYILDKHLFKDIDFGSLTKAGIYGSKKEGIQEASQSIIQQMSQGEIVDWSQALYEGSIGAVVGGGATGVQQAIREGKGRDIAKQAIKDFQKAGEELKKAEDRGEIPPVEEGPPGAPAEPWMAEYQFVPKQMNQRELSSVTGILDRDPVAALRMAVEPEFWPAVKEFASNVAATVEESEVTPEAKAETTKALIAGKVYDTLGIPKPPAPAPLAERKEAPAPIEERETLPPELAGPAEKPAPEIPEIEEVAREITEEERKEKEAVEQFKETPVVNLVEEVQKAEAGIPPERAEEVEELPTTAEIVAAKEVVAKEEEMPEEEFLAPEEEEMDVTFEPEKYEREKAEAGKKKAEVPEAEIPLTHPAALPKTEALKRFPGITAEQHRAIVENQLKAGREVPGEVLESYPGIEEDILRAMAREEKKAEVKKQPLRKLIKSMGYIRRDIYDKYYGGELEEEKGRLIRKKGQASMSDAAQAAHEAGLIPEYDENTLIEAIKRESFEKEFAVFEKEAEYKDIFERPEEVKEEKIASKKPLGDEEQAFPEGSQAAMSKVIDNVEKNVKPVGQWHDLRLEKVVKKVEKAWKKKGTWNYAGTRIETIQDVAEIAAVYRHPIIEHAQVILIKDGKHIGSKVFSSGKISSVVTDPAVIVDSVVKSGADEVYFTHNHPSGNPVPSSEDLRYSESVKKLIQEGTDAKFSGQIVNDHKTFTFIKPDGNYDTISYKSAKERFREKETAQYLTPGIVAEQAKKFLKGDLLCMFFLDSRSNVMSVDNVEPASNFNKYARDNSKKYGAISVILTTNEVGFSKLKGSKKKVTFIGDYLDLIVMRNDGTYLSAANRDLPDVFLAGKWGGEEGVFDFGARERPAPYGKGELQKKMGKKKIVPGKELTVRIAIKDDTLKKGRLPRGRKVTLVSANVEDAVFVVTTQDGEYVVAPASAFVETYVKPPEIKPIPGRPVKTAISESAGLKDLSPKIEFTELEALKEKFRNQTRGAMYAERETRRKARSELIEKFKAEKYEAKQAKTDLTKYLAEHIPVAKRGKEKYMLWIKNVETKKALAKILMKVDREAEHVYRRSLVDDIKKLTNRGLESANVAVSYKEKIRELLKDIELTAHRAKTIERLENARLWIYKQEKEGKSVNVPEDILNKIQILARKPLNTIPTEHLEYVLDTLKLYDTLGRQKAASMHNVWEMRKRLVLDELLEVAKPVENLKEKLLPGIRETEWGTELYLDFMPMDRVFDFFDGATRRYNGPHYRFKRDMDGNWQLYQKMKDAYLFPIVDKVNKRKMDGKTMERIGIYAAKMQRGGLERVLVGRPNLTKEYVEKLELNEDEMEIYKDMRAAMEKTFPLVKRVMAKLYNKEVASVDHYFSYLLDWDMLNSLQVFERLAKSKEGYIGPIKSVHKGFSIKRLPGAKKPIKTNAFDVFRKHMDDVCYLLAMQEPIKFYYEIFNSEKYKEKVGPEVSRRMLTYMDLLARKGGGEQSDMLPWLDSLRINIGHAILGFRLSSIAVQMTALMDASALIGGNYVRKGLERVIKDKNFRKWLMNNFPELKARVGDDIAFVELSDKLWLKKWQEKGLYPMRAFDMFAAAATVVGAYEKTLEEAGKEFQTEVVDKDASDEAMRIMRLTQSSGQWKDMGLAFVRGKAMGKRVLFGNKSLNKAFLQFRSFVTGRFALMSYDLPGQDAKDMSWGYAYMVGAVAMETGIRWGVRSFILSLLGLAGWGVGKSLGDEDDELLEEMLFQMVESVPFVSDVSRIYRYGSLPSPFLGALMKIVAGRDYLLGRSEYEKMRGLRRGLDGLASFSGMPGSSQAMQLWYYALNRNSLFFPWETERRDLKAKPLGERTVDEQERYEVLSRAKIRFNFFNRRYKHAMETDNIDLAKETVKETEKLFREIK